MSDEVIRKYTDYYGNPNHQRLSAGPAVAQAAAPQGKPPRDKSNDDRIVAGTLGLGAGAGAVVALKKKKKAGFIDDVSGAVREGTSKYISQALKTAVK